MTAPVSDWLVSTRIASSAEAMSCSGRAIRSQYRETGRNASLTDTSCDHPASSCWSTDPTRRVAKTSPGSSSTGSRLMVAPAAPVTMLVAPGPTELVQARVWSRLAIRAKPAAVCTWACSLRDW